MLTADNRAYWPLGSEPRLVLEFALETASRRCEVVHLGRQHVKAGRIKIKRAKGCNGVDIPVSPELQAALDAMPASDHLTYLIARSGEPYSPEAARPEVCGMGDRGGAPEALPSARPAQEPESGTTGRHGHRPVSPVHRSCGQAT